MQDGFAHCEQLVRAADSDRFFAALFAPAAKRPGLFALYAFNIEVMRVRDLAREPMPGEIRMQWWRDVLAGERGAEALSHPVAAPLLETIRRHDLPRAALLDLIEARSFDLYDDPMGSLRELEGYGEKTDATIIGLAGAVLSGTPLGAIARHSGIAQTIVAVTRALPRHASRGQIYLPADLMRARGASAGDLLAGRMTGELGDALSDLRTVARRHLAAAGSLWPELPPDAQAALLPLAVTRLRLDSMARESDPFRPKELPQWRQQWALWRASHDPLRMF